MSGSSEKIWTVGEILKFSSRYLKEKTQLDSSSLDCQLLLSELIGMDRVHLYMNLDRPVSLEEREKFKSYLKRRINGEPIAYITGRKNFWTSSFRLTHDTLIPRADSESVVELALDYVDYSKKEFSCLDIGTGSGCLLISVAKTIKEKVDKILRSKKQELKESLNEKKSEDSLDSNTQEEIEVEVEIEIEKKIENLRPSFYYEAWDISEAALKVAGLNASEIIPGIDINFYNRDVLSVLGSDTEVYNKFDLIISNPPYIEPDDPRVDSSIKFEPDIALYAKDLVFYRKISALAKKILKDHGVVVVEVGKDQAHRVVDIFEKEGLRLDKRLKDLAGIDRALSFCSSKS